jgi:hypothetical protein
MQPVAGAEPLRRRERAGRLGIGEGVSPGRHERDGMLEGSDLDAIIMSHVEKRWLKVARIAGQTIDDCGAGPTDTNIAVVVARLRELVALGRREAVGNLSRVRFSEVRLPAGEGG